MSRVLTAAGGIGGEFIADVRERLSNGQGVRRRLPGGGRLHMDRRLPFLVLYRERGSQKVGESSRLVVGEAAYLIAPGAVELQDELRDLVTAIADAMCESFGVFLLLEVWLAREGEAAAKTARAKGVRAPTFRVVTSALPPDDDSVRSLFRALTQVPLRPPPLDVEVVVERSAGAPGLPPMLPDDGFNRGMHMLGIEVQPVHRQARTGVPYPEVFETLRRGLSLAVKQTAYHFTVTHGREAPTHFLAFGRRVAVKAAELVDAELSEMARTFDFLLQVTPVNTARARVEFDRHGRDRVPAFDYRPLAVDTDSLRRRLYDLPLERLEDPTLASVFRESREELARKLTMLGDRNTPRFLYGSLGVFGTVETPLLELAHLMLERIPGAGDEVVESGDDRPQAVDERLDAEGFLMRAQLELDGYRERLASFRSRAEIRDDVSGLMVSMGNLLIGRRTMVPMRRVDALLQHEIGTHVVTFANGEAQPLGLLATGLAGYEELQEGMAVLAEHLVGGLDGGRLRLLAARVVAVRSVIDGADFVETYRLLTAEHGIRPASAFTMSMRVHRGGGLTKDVVYLRGLVRLLDYLADGGDLRPLYVGKVAFEQLPQMRELLWREYLKPPALRPNYLNAPGARARLARLRTPHTVMDLIPEPTK